VAAYTVTYVQDGATWFARIAEIEGCHTQGRTIEEARERIRGKYGALLLRFRQRERDLRFGLQSGVRAP
jgi:hypothetical protein